MSAANKFSNWIALILRKFGRGTNLSGDYKWVEQAAIPTVSMVADWARDERTDISEMWVFGSVVEHDTWDCFADDIDILLIIPDNLWKPGDEVEIPKEVPLSEHYLPMDIRVRKQSDCDSWRSESVIESEEGNHKMTVAEYAMRTGVCVWRRTDENKRDSQD